MAEILHDLTIAAPIDRVFDGIATSRGLDEWWTESSSGEPREGAEYILTFTPEFVWRAKVSRCRRPEEFELTITDALEDWVGTTVGFNLVALDAGTTRLEFRHAGWAEATPHFRNSSFCWALYLKILRGYLENGTRFVYADRYSV